MKLQARARLLLFVSIAAALIVSHGVVVAAGTHAMPAHAAAQRGSVEDDVVGFTEGEEEAYPKRRVLYSPQSVSYGGLRANKAACYGSCPARGRPYTGGGCQKIYGCRGR